MRIARQHVERVVHAVLEPGSSTKMTSSTTFPTPSARAPILSQRDLETVVGTMAGNLALLAGHDDIASPGWFVVSEECA